jgi:hypothetical protein
MPAGSNLVWMNLLTKTFSGTPYCSAIEMEVAKASMRPEIVLPSFDITTNISPGVPSPYKPTIR